MSVAILETLKSIRKIKPFAALSEWHSNQMGYRKLGLRFDDLVPDESEIIQESIKRLTPTEYFDRIFRLRRALMLSSKKDILPASEWTSVEHDVPYLRPIIEQVEKEVSIRQYYDNMTTIPAALLKRNRCV